MSSFKRWFSSIPLVLCLLALCACGQTVQVPSGTVGRQQSTSGLEEKIYEPGGYRLEACPFSACPVMVLLHTGLASEEINVGTIFLPQSNVDLSEVKIAIQFHTRPTEGAINKIYADVTSVHSEGSNDYTREITSDMQYSIYLQRMVPNLIIATLRDFTVEQALSDVDGISKAALKRINEEMKDQPVEVTEVGFPNGIGKPPEQVLEAKRNLYVVKENVTRQIQELEGQLGVEKQRQIVQQLRVNNDVANAKTAGLPVGEYMLLKTMERFADDKVPLGFVPGLSSFTQNQ